MRRVLLAFLFVLLLPLSAAATEYFVAKTGSDANACTSGSPCLTINHGLTKLVGGDTLTIKAGTYVELIIPDIGTTQIPSGSSEGTRTIIRGAPGETVVLSASEAGTGAGHGIELQNSGAWITFQNLIIDGRDGVGSPYAAASIKQPAHHIRFKDIEVRNMKWGAFSGNGNDVDYININIHNFGQCTQFGACGYPFYWSGNRTLFDNVTIDATASLYNDMYCYHIYESTYPDKADITIRNGSLRGCVHGIMSTATTRMIIENTIIYGGQFGIHVWSGSNDITIRNNTIYGQSRSAIDLTNGSVATAAIKNNIIYNNQETGIEISEGTNVTVQNNLSSANGGGGNCRDSGTHGPSGTNACTGSSATNNLFGAYDPLFVDAAAHDFHLRSGSPAIDSGQTISGLTTDKDGAPRPQGAAYDIGAYEFGGAQTPPPQNQLVSHWLMNEGSGTSVADSGPDANTGTLINGVTWSTTPTRLTFAAASQQYMSTAKDLIPTVGKSFTAIFRLMTTQVSASANWWLSPGILGVATYGSSNSVAITLDTAGKLRVNRWDSTLTTSGAINDGTERCVAVTANSANGAAQIYLDSTLNVSGTLDTGTKSASFSSIGRLTASNGDHKYLSGSLRDFRLYNYVLSGTEITNACGATPAFDFTVAHDGNKTVPQTGSVTGTVTVNKTAGTAAAVTLSALNLPTGASAAFSPTSCTPSTSCTSTMTITTSAVTTGTYTTPKVRGTAGAETRDSSAFTLTVTAVVAGETFTQGKGRIGGADWSPFRWQRPPNTNGTIVPGGRASVALHVSVTGADPAAAFFDLWASKNGGAYALVPETCTLTGVCFASGALTHDSVLNARILPQVEATYVAGRVLARQPTTQIDLSQGSETNFLCYVGVGADVIAGTDTFRFRLQRRSGQVMNTYSAGADVLLSVVKPGRFFVSGPAFSTD